MADIKLSICIATLNRADLIGQTLNSIVDQITGDVEIVIVDGASTDATPDVIAEFQLKYPQIKYVRLAEKGGVDRDYDKAVKAATGEYCWLFSDDDVLAPDALNSVLNLLEKRKPLSILVNASVWNQDFSTKLQESRLKTNIKEYYEPSTSVEFFIDTVMFVTFIGCVVIQKDYWLKSSAERFFGSEFIHLGVLYHKPLEGRVYIIQTPLIRIRYGIASWKPRQFRIWLVQFPNLINSFEWLPQNVRRRFIPVSMFGAFKQAMKFRASGALNMSTVLNSILPLKCSNWIKFWSVIFLFIPRFIVAKLVRYYFYRARPDSKILMNFEIG